MLEQAKYNAELIFFRKHIIWYLKIMSDRVPILLDNSELMPNNTLHDSMNKKRICT